MQKQTQCQVPRFCPLLRHQGLIGALCGDLSVQVGSQAPRALAPAPPCLPHLRDVLQVDAVAPVETWLAVVHQHVIHVVGAEFSVGSVIVDGG